MNDEPTTTDRKNELRRLARNLRGDIRNTDDLQLKAVYETTAEVILGLAKTMEDFEKGVEAAWR